MAKKKMPAGKDQMPETLTRRTVLTIKGTDEWRGWLERLGEKLRMPTSTIVDHALIKYAREMGFEEAAPKR